MKCRARRWRRWQKRKYGSCWPSWTRQRDGLVSDIGNSPQATDRARIDYEGTIWERRDAENRSRRSRNLLRGPWRRATAVADPRLFVDLGDVARSDRVAVEALQACAVGHA